MSFSSNGLRGFVSRKLKLIKSILSRPGTGWLSPFFGQLAKAASLPAQVAHPAILGAFLFPKQRGKSKKNGTSFFVVVVQSHLATGKSECERDFSHSLCSVEFWESGRSVYPLLLLDCLLFSTSSTTHTHG